MNKKLLLIGAISISSLSFSQQIDNGDFEQWENVVATFQEPVNWNSFLTATGIFSSSGQNQIEASSDVRPGSAGTKSAKIWSKEVINSIIANGNMTLGRVFMGAAQADHPANHNRTIRSDSDFSQILSQRPDSIVFWAKYVPVNAAGNQARMKATIHLDYDCRDPEDAASIPNVTARAIENFPSTNGWQRFSVPFEYEEGIFFNSYILVTFTTNMTPGGGSDNDQLWVDDVELIYNADNPANIEEQSNLDVAVHFDNVSSQLNILSEENLTGSYSVVNLAGQVVQSGKLESTIQFYQPTGMYIVRLESEGKFFETKIVKN